MTRGSKLQPSKITSIEKCTKGTGGPAASPGKVLIAFISLATALPGWSPGHLRKNKQTEHFVLVFLFYPVSPQEITAFCPLYRSL